MTRPSNLSHLALLVGLAALTAGCGGGPGRPGRPPRPTGGQTATPTSGATGGTETNVAKKPIDKATLGKVKVTVKYEGDPVANRKIKMDSDPFCASTHEKEAMQEKFLRNANMTMANAVVYLADGWQVWEAPKPEGRATLDQHGCIYRPHVISVQTQQEIEFKNSDNTLHNVHPTPKKNKAFNKATPANSSAVEKFLRDEMGIGVKCDVHPWMKSYISVFKHPWHAVTPEGDGAAVIEAVPAGKYKLAAWHEELQDSKPVDIEVKAGQTVEVTLGF